MAKLKTEVFLDSGAYTAWKLDVGIDLDKYCDFIIANKEHIGAYVALDVIPGRPGEDKRKKKFEEAAEEGLRNYKHMLKRGLDPMPVCHQGESWKWLDEYLDLGATYIGLSTAKDRNRRDQRDWLDEAYRRITDETGKPLVRTHGFGITTVEFIARYPWHSYDSAAWAKQAAAGKLLVPPPNIDGTYNFAGHPTSVVMSGARHRFNRVSHMYERMGVVQRDFIIKYCADFGFTVDDGSLTDVKNYVPARRAMNILFFQRMSEALNVTHFKHRRKVSLWRSNS